MSGSNNYADILVSAQKQRKKYSETLDTLYSETEARTAEVIACTDSEDLWQYRDRLEEMRALVYKLRRSATRNLAEVEDSYKDGIRNAMSLTKSTNGLHFSEREAKYEMQFITEYKILNNLERMVEDLNSFSRYLEGRLNWVKDRQRWLQQR